LFTTTFRSSDYSVFPEEKLIKSTKEEILVEKSINSVRISIRIKKNDELDSLLCRKFARFMMQRAENFIILRRKPVKVGVRRLKLIFIAIF
jgi:hypothetical protein